MQCFEVGVVGDKRMKGVQEEEHNKRFLRGEKRGFQGKGKEMMLEWKICGKQKKMFGRVGRGVDWTTTGDVTAERRD